MSWLARLTNTPEFHLYYDINFLGSSRARFEFKSTFSDPPTTAIASTYAHNATSGSYSSVLGLG
jgi:hypothetical protein